MKMYFKSGETDLFISVDFCLCLSSRQDLLRSKLQKPPGRYKDPLEALFTRPSGKFSHSSLQKVRVRLSGD